MDDGAIVAARAGGIKHSEEGGYGLANWYRLAILQEPLAMTTTQDLVAALKAELRRAGVTYADLAKELLSLIHISEPTRPY